MSSTGFQRKLDLAPTASIDKVALNNRVVLMRAIVRRSKLHLINALVKKVHKLRDKKGTEGQKSQNKNKADRMLEDIKIIKVLKPDYVSKYALGTTEKFEDLAAKPGTSADMRALARLAAHKFIMQEVGKFRHEHEDWKELAAYLMTKHTSREFKKKKTKEKLKKVETNVKASETLVQKYLGEKLEGRNDLDHEVNERNNDDNDDVDDSSDEADESVKDIVEKKNRIINDRGRTDSLTTEIRNIESVRKKGINQNFCSLKSNTTQKQTDKKNAKNSIQSEVQSENVDSDSISDEDSISRVANSSKEEEEDYDESIEEDDDECSEGNSDEYSEDDGDDNEGSKNDEEEDESSSSVSEDDADDNEQDLSKKLTSDKMIKHKAKLLDMKTNIPDSKGVLSKKSLHKQKDSKSDKFTKTTEKKKVLKEKIEGDMIVKKLDLAKDFVEDEIPKILLSEKEDKPVKRKKKTKDLFFDTGEDDDCGSNNKDTTEVNDDGNCESVDNEAIDSDMGRNFESSIQPTMTAFTTCFVGSLKSSDMMACKDSQYRSNEDWKRIRHETKEQKMGRGRGSSPSFSRGRGYGPALRGRGSSNSYVADRDRGRGFSDGFRGRGFSQGPRGQEFSESRGRGSEGFRGRGRGSEGFRGRGRGSEGFQGRGRGRGFERPGREDGQNDRRGLGNTQKQGGLHPSWEASKKRKQEQKAVLQAFEGKKIKFD
ncbi:serum response factor-binding protein 1-like [Mercenaria mercenaria]|uniref:serum response factor-binding protein 1-like n=1 Tax=Mercenaria mercenaria TaxID=6596 RepID=UPI00234F1BE9|nr:serum response factor-binding protein 1-like [Mercenaria mercenaria]